LEGRSRKFNGNSSSSKRVSASTVSQLSSRPLPRPGKVQTKLKFPVAVSLSTVSGRIGYSVGSTCDDVSSSDRFDGCSARASDSVSVVSSDNCLNMRMEEQVPSRDEGSICVCGCHWLVADEVLLDDCVLCECFSVRYVFLFVRILKKS
jgi:hypothetical protein